MVLPTLVHCHLVLWSFLWNSAVLALWLLCSPMRGANTCILLAAYVVPLAELYRKEVVERRAFALAPGPAGACAGPGRTQADGLGRR